jgi:hypothetical protein
VRYPTREPWERTIFRVRNPPGSLPQFLGWCVTVADFLHVAADPVPRR